MLKIKEAGRRWNLVYVRKATNEEVVVDTGDTLEEAIGFALECDPTWNGKIERSHATPRLEELPNGDFRDHAEELANAELLREE